jgi:hypothetical protein
MHDEAWGAVPAWETNCLVDGEGGPADETSSSGVAISLKVGLSEVCCCVCGWWFTPVQ